MDGASIGRLRREIEAVKPWTYLHDGGVDEFLPRPVVIALLDAAEAPENPCCYSLHEFEHVCPRTGRTFRP